MRLKKVILLGVLLISFAVNTGFSKEISENISVENMMDVVNEMGRHPRETGTPEIEEAQKYIQSILHKEGYEVREQTYYYTDEDNVDALRNRADTEKFLNGGFTEDENNGKKGVNLIAEMERNPEEKTLIISAHYDTNGISVGANDNASGVASALELARLLKNQDLHFNVEFVFFSGEENFWLGSRYYVGQLSEEERKNLAGVINIDTVAEKSPLNYWIMVADGEETTDENGVVDFEPKANEISVLFENDDRFQAVCQFNSDHYPFSLCGIPAVSIVQDLSEGTTANTTEDTLERIDSVTDWNRLFQPFLML